MTALLSSGHTICSLSPALLISPLQCIKLEARPVISNSAEKLASYSRKDERGGGSHGGGRSAVFRQPGPGSGDRWQRVKVKSQSGSRWSQPSPAQPSPAQPSPALLRARKLSIGQNTAPRLPAGHWAAAAGQLGPAEYWCQERICPAWRYDAEPAVTSQ